MNLHERILDLIITILLLILLGTCFFDYYYIFKKPNISINIKSSTESIKDDLNKNNNLIIKFEQENK